MAVSDRITALEELIAKVEASGVQEYRTPDGRVVRRIDLPALQSQLERLIAQRDAESGGDRRTVVGFSR